MPLNNSVLIGSDALRPANESPAGATVLGLADRRSLRVLVVDDNKDAADSLCMLAELWGFQGERAYDGFSALEMIPIYRPDVLVLDFAMPKMDGCRLAQQVRALATCKETLLIAITGYAGTDSRLRCARAGFDHFLVKPADPLAIKELLQRRCGSRSSGRAAVSEFALK